MGDIDPQPLLAAGRQAHQDLMVDACTITRPGTPTLNRTTSQLTPGPATTLYSGPFRIRPQRTPSPTEAGERRQVVARYNAALPFGALPSGALRIGDVVTVTASADPRMVGQTMTVMAIDYASTATAWRLTLEDLT
ncbi:MAG: hypothetical protein JWO67_1968 [Streptosporangiaceae bacterium]|nr:hypothetical protein [Streptosporangiaceae bacterium]